MILLRCAHVWSRIKRKFIVGKNSISYLFRSYLTLRYMGTSISIAFAVMSFAFLYLMLINGGSYMPIHIYFCKKPFLYLLQQSAVAHIWLTKKQCQITIQIYWNKELLSALLHTAATRISFLGGKKWSAYKRSTRHLQLQCSVEKMVFYHLPYLPTLQSTTYTTSISL